MRYALIALCALLFSLPARADCSNPGGAEGSMIYNADYKTVQFCDGAQWWSMKGDSVGLIRIAAANNSPCNSSMEGGLRYNSTSKVVEICNGSAWESIVLASGTGTPSTPPATAGYFVITSGTYNGNLGGLSGGNSKCLTDLQNNDWNGTPRAGLLIQHMSGHGFAIRAFPSARTRLPTRPITSPCPATIQKAAPLLPRTPAARGRAIRRTGRV